MNVGASQGITNAFFRIKIGRQNFTLFGFGKFIKCFRRGIGERAANAQDGLERFRGGFNKKCILVFR